MAGASQEQGPWRTSDTFTKVSKATRKGGYIVSVTPDKMVGLVAR